MTTQHSSIWNTLISLSEEACMYHTDEMFMHEAQQVLATSRNPEHEHLFCWGWSSLWPQTPDRLSAPFSTHLFYMQDMFK